MDGFMALPLTVAIPASGWFTKYDPMDRAIRSCITLITMPATMHAALHMGMTDGYTEQRPAGQMITRGQFIGSGLTEVFTSCCISSQTTGLSNPKVISRLKMV